jgi:PAS domain S-box-containing protein
VADENGKFLFWNAAAEHLVGLGPQDVPPTEWAAVFGIFLPDGTTPYPTEDLPLVRAIRGQYVDGHELLLRNARFPTGIWVSVSARPLNDAENKPCGGVVVFHDITERKRAEDKLRQSETLLAEAQQVAHIGSWNWDIANDTIVWSDEHYRICGLKPQEEAITFERGMSFVHPDDRATTWQIVEQALQDHQPYECCLRLLHPDGTVRIAQSRGQAQYDDEGKPVRMFGTLQDITERKRSEDKLRRQKEIFQAIFDHAPLMIRFTDSAARILLVNPHWENVMGWTLEEAQKHEIWAEFYPDLADRQRMLEFSRQSTGTWADFKVRVRDGRVREICWASIRLSDDVRVAIGQDVTDRRQEEQTRAAYSSRLQALSRRLVEVQEEERRHLARELHDEIGQMLTGLGFLLAPNGDLPPDAIRARCRQAREIVDETLKRIREISSDLRPAALDHLGLSSRSPHTFRALHQSNQGSGRLQTSSTRRTVCTRSRDNGLSDRSRGTHKRGPPCGSEGRHRTGLDDSRCAERANRRPRSRFRSRSRRGDDGFKRTGWDGRTHQAGERPTDGRGDPDARDADHSRPASASSGAAGGM